MFTFAHGFLNGTETVEASTLVLHAATYDPDTYLVGDEIVSDTPTFVHADTIYVKDHEDIYRALREDVRVVKGARVVENLVLWSEDYAEASVWSHKSMTLTTGRSDPRGGTGAVTFSGEEFGQQGTSLVSGETYVASFWLRRRSGSSELAFRSLSSYIEFASLITSSWQRFSFENTVGVDSWLVRLEAYNTSDEYDIFEIETELVSGRGNQISPSEYIATNASTAIHCFVNENGNTVSDNIVTEIVSTTLLNPLPMTVYQRASTNLFLNSNAPATQNVTVVSGNDYVVWVDGGTGNVVLSGAATGTVTKAGGFVTFSTATTTLTLTYTATLDHVQVETGLVPTGKIATTGSTAATDETINTYPSANWSNSEGPIYLVHDYKGIDEVILLNDDVAILYVTSDVLYLGDGTNTASIAYSVEGEHEIGIVLDTVGNKMKLNLDGTYSTESNYDNSFGTGDINIEATFREYKRKDETSYTAQQTILNGWMP